MVVEINGCPHPAELSLYTFPHDTAEAFVLEESVSKTFLDSFDLAGISEAEDDQDVAIEERIREDTTSGSHRLDFVCILRDSMDGIMKLSMIRFGAQGAKSEACRSIHHAGRFVLLQTVNEMFSTPSCRKVRASQIHNEMSLLGITIRENRGLSSRFIRTSHVLSDFFKQSGKFDRRAEFYPRFVLGPSAHFAILHKCELSVESNLRPSILRLQRCENS